VDLVLALTDAELQHAQVGGVVREPLAEQLVAVALLLQNQPVFLYYDHLLLDVEAVTLLLESPCEDAPVRLERLAHDIRVALFARRAGRVELSSEQGQELIMRTVFLCSF